MSAETLGEAYDAGWRVCVRCPQGKRSGMKSIRECLHEAELDMGSLVWTRGRAFPIALLAETAEVPPLRIAARERDVLSAEPPRCRQRRPAQRAARRCPIGRIGQRGPNGRLESVIATTPSMAVAEAAFAAAVECHSVAKGGRLVLLKDGGVVAEHPPREAAERDTQAAE